MYLNYSKIINIVIRRLNIYFFPNLNFNFLPTVIIIIVDKLKIALYNKINVGINYVK